MLSINIVLCLTIRPQPLCIHYPASGQILGQHLTLLFERKKGEVKGKNNKTGSIMALTSIKVI